jgi:outer membrane protein assembly factor BamB
LSFYGHLDPPSVILKSGECVARGDKVGEIGDPTSSPHLHFEIRKIFPYNATRGYVSSDPTDLGWLPPSSTIHTYRIQTSPGVLWTQPSTDWKFEPIGRFGENNFVIATNLELLGFDLTDGAALWRHPFITTMRDFVIDRTEEIIYTVDRMGLVEAHQLVDETNASAEYPVKLETIWSYNLESSRIASLIPLPDGGITISLEGRLVAYSDQGEELWNEDQFPQVNRWNLSEDTLYLTTEGDETGLWMIQSSEPPELLSSIGGKVASSDNFLWIYNNEGISALKESSSSPEMLHSLPTAYPSLGDMTIIPDGGLLLVHTDIYDRRLLVFDQGGTLLWERSFSAVLPLQPTLLELGGVPYLIAHTASSQKSKVTVFSLDLEDANLVRIFEGGSRGTYSRATWVVKIDDDKILINIGGSQLILLDTTLAGEAVSFEPTTP